MRALVLAVALSISGAAFADDLADANKALMAKSYPQAMELFGRLAAAGNAEARFRLGEMYWYGQGVPADRAKGDALFAQAASAGISAASTALTRSARRAEIEQARVHLDRVYADVADKAQAGANALVAQHGAWEKATLAYVGEANKQAGVRSSMEKAQLELRMHQHDGRQAVANPPPPPPPPAGGR